jgi:hypothetical protein
MTRWRLESWQPERPAVVLRKHWSHKCKLCAINRAIDQARSMDVAWQLLPGTCEWTVSKVDGHMTRWSVVARSGINYGSLPVRHGH